MNTLLGYYSGLNTGNLMMLLGFMKTKTFYNKKDILIIPVLLPRIEKIILEKSGMESLLSNIRFVNLFNIPVIIKSIKFSRNLYLMLGDMVTTNYGAFSSLFLLYNIILSLPFKKKCIILPSSLIPLKQFSPLIKKLIKNAKIVYLRSNIEKSILSRLKLKNITTMEDLSMKLIRSYKIKGRKRTKRMFVTVILRNSSHKYLKLSENTFIKKVLDTILRYVDDPKNTQILLLPFQIGIRKSVDDRKILKKVLMYIRRETNIENVLLVEKISLKNMITVISRSRIVITSRYHPMIVSYMLGVKTLVIPESQKNIFFVRDNNSRIIQILKTFKH